MLGSLGEVGTIECGCFETDTDGRTWSRHHVVERYPTTGRQQDNVPTTTAWLLRGAVCHDACALSDSSAREWLDLSLA